MTILAFFAPLFALLVLGLVLIRRANRGDEMVDIVINLPATNDAPPAAFRHEIPRRYEVRVNRALEMNEMLGERET